MNFLDHTKEGLRNLAHAKLRSFLAVLGVLVGTASVVVMVLGGEIATHEALRAFQSLGTDLLSVMINRSSDDEEKKNNDLTLENVKRIRQSDEHILNAAPYTQSFSPLLFEGKKLDSMVLGVTRDFASIASITLQSGRFVSEIDGYSLYCVIGQDVYQTIKTHTFHDPVGQTIQMGDYVFVIVGVLNEWPESGFIYADINHSILVPIKTSMMISQYAKIENIIFKLDQKASILAVEKNIENEVIKWQPDKMVRFQSAKELVHKMEQQSHILNLFLGLVGSISLFVGGIGVMNIMLVTITERKREIGIRLAVGARRRDIALMFLAESIMLSLVGGLFGVILGVMAAYVVASLSHWTFVLFWYPMIVGFSVSVFVGIFFGFYPAVRASRLSPIVALRLE